MRNLWYPTKKAEYMTTARMQQLKISKTDIGERDPLFGTQVEIEEEVIGDAVDAVAGYVAPAHGVEIEHIAVSIAQALGLFLRWPPTTIIS